MADRGRKETDRILARMEKRIRSEYKQAHKEVTDKLNKHLEAYARKDERKRDQLKRGVITKEQYRQWKVGQIAVGKRWEQLREVLATDYANTNMIARSVVQEHIPEAYAIGHNYATYKLEHDSQIDTNYTLYSKEAVEHLLRMGDRELPLKRLLPLPTVNGESWNAMQNGDIAWNQRQIQSAVLQGILQGDSIGDIASRMQKVTNMNRASAIRTARTSMTGAENAGRQDAMERASRYGLKVSKTWLATLDERTRESHRALDGTSIPQNEVFDNGCEYPGDPDGPPEEVWNCRCTLLTEYEGYENTWTDFRNRNTDKLGDMTYDEWVKAKPVYSPITRPDKVAKKMRAIYAADYRR